MGAQAEAAGRARALAELLGRWRPRAVLLVGEDPEGAVAAWAAGERPPPEVVRRAPAAALADPARPGGRWDLAVLGPDVAGTLARAEAGRLVAALRDVHARRLVLALPEPVPAGWEAPACVALGLTPVGEGGRLWRFDLHDYKETPDWLNPRFWAHPELWDRFRW